MIDALIGRQACAALKNSTCSVSLQLHCVAGLMELDAHLSRADRGAARITTPVPPLSVPLLHRAFV